MPSTTLFPWAFPQQRDDDLQQGEADEWLRPPEVEENGRHHISLQSALAAPGLLQIIHNAVWRWSMAWTKLSHVCNMSVALRAGGRPASVSSIHAIAPR